MDISSEKYQFFHKTFVSYYTRVFCFVYKFLKDKEATENITQDTFVVFWENIDKIDKNVTPLPYLFFVSKNKVLNHIRKNKTIDKYTDYIKLRERSLATKILESSTLEKINFSEIETLIEKSIDKMNDKTKEAFILNRFKNCSFEEISVMLGVSVKTVEYRMASALRIVSKYLKDYIQ